MLYDLSYVAVEVLRLSVEYIVDLIKENSQLKERIAELERAQEQHKERDAWGQYRSMEEILR